jgi:hypothetical protein
VSRRVRISLIVRVCGARKVYRVLIATAKGPTPHLHRVPILRKPLPGGSTVLPMVSESRRPIRFRVRHSGRSNQPRLRGVYFGASFQSFGWRSPKLAESHMTVGSRSAKALRGRESGVSSEEEDSGDGEVLECCL